LLEKTNPDSQRIILNVLKPYTEGIKVRLDALEQIQQLISRLLQNINEMYTDKSVQFDMNEGLRVISHKQMLLTPQMLSSGEKQLLLLICDIIAAREMPSIFIIDEPEISLNVKWQRRLIKVLLDCIKGSSVQFVLATHSIELLTGYKEYVVKLVDH
jgi:energy-coupling factor transporter ATP-binding protein EcfA2